MRLSDAWRAAVAAGHWSMPTTWRPVPPASDRSAWTAIRSRWATRSAAICRVADESVGEPWPELTDAQAARFASQGDRLAWQRPQAERRRRSTALAVAEALRGDGRLLPALAAALRSICQERSWCAPAHWHMARLPRGTPLAEPPADRELVDIYAGITAGHLAEAYALHRDGLEALDPGLGELLRTMLRRRLFDPVLDFDDWFWWPGQHNWSVWIAANALTAAAHLLDDAAAERAVVDRFLAVVDRFVARYAADGGCDEGPGYWSHAAGSLLLVLELLHDRSGGHVDGFGDARFRAMARYIEDIRLDGDHFWALADCGPRVRPPPAKVWRLGSRCGMDELHALARRSLHSRGGLATAALDIGLVDLLRELHWIDPAAPAPAARPRPKRVWWPSLEVLVARSHARDGEGLVLGVKAGSNVEAHNHNDVGQVCLVLDGQPLVVDPGVGTYRQAHFGPERYAIWTQGSAGHNAPVLDGRAQLAATGWGYQAPAGQAEPAAAGVDLLDGAAGVGLAMAIGACYGEAPEAVQRRVLLQAGSESVLIEDRLAATVGDARIWLYTPVEPRLVAGRIRLAAATRYLEIDGDGAAVAWSEQDLEDQQLRSAWGRLWRIELCWRHRRGWSIRGQVCPLAADPLAASADPACRAASSG